MNKDEMLEKIEQEILPKLSDWTDITKKVDNIPFKDYNQVFKFEKCKFSISDKFSLPASEEELNLIGNVLLHIVQNPDLKTTDEMINAVGFEKMLDNLLKI